MLPASWRNVGRVSSSERQRPPRYTRRIEKADPEFKHERSLLRSRCWCFVSGHDFSRAENTEWMRALAPEVRFFIAARVRLFGNGSKSRTSAAKAALNRKIAARLKSGPDTKQQRKRWAKPMIAFAESIMNA